MQTVHRIHGRLIGPTTVELDQPAPPQANDAEVWLRVAANPSSQSTGDVFEFLRTTPPGTLTKHQIDARLRADRDDWEGR